MRWIDPMAILSLIWAIFYDSRVFMGTLCTKSNPQNPNSLCLKMKSLEGMIKSIMSSIIPIYSDISSEFEKE